jgi:hypothetical protein
MGPQTNFHQTVHIWSETFFGKASHVSRKKASLPLPPACMHYGWCGVGQNIGNVCQHLRIKFGVKICIPYMTIQVGIRFGRLVAA